MPTLTQKSQVTIPKQIREALGVGPGDEVEFGVNNSTVVLHKKKKKLPLDKWVGYLGRLKTDEVMAELR